MYRNHDEKSWNNDFVHDSLYVRDTSFSEKNYTPDIIHLSH